MERLTPLSETMLRKLLVVDNEIAFNSLTAASDRLRTKHRSQDNDSRRVRLEAANSEARVINNGFCLTQIDLGGWKNSWGYNETPKWAFTCFRLHKSLRINFSRFYLRSERTCRVFNSRVSKRKWRSITKNNSYRWFPIRITVTVPACSERRSSMKMRVMDCYGKVNSDFPP